MRNTSKNEIVTREHALIAAELGSYFARKLSLADARQALARHREVKRLSAAGRPAAVPLSFGAAARHSPAVFEQPTTRVSTHAAAKGTKPMTSLRDPKPRSVPPSAPPRAARTTHHEKRAPNVESRVAKLERELAAARRAEAAPARGEASPAAADSAMDAAMGLEGFVMGVRREGNAQIFGAMRPQQAHAIQDGDPGRNPHAAE